MMTLCDRIEHWHCREHRRIISVQGRIRCLTRIEPGERITLLRADCAEPTPRKLPHALFGVTIVPTTETRNTTTALLEPPVDAVSALPLIVDSTRFASRIRDWLQSGARLLLLSGLMLPTLASAATFTPTVLTDLTIGSLANVNASGQITTQGNAITLRSAVIAANAANAAGNSNTINLLAGTYQLTIPGTGETSASGDALIGDLDVLVPASGTVTVTVQGAGAALTTIQQTTGIDRIFDLHPVNLAGSVNFTLTGVRLTGGHNAISSGGAILAGRPGDVTNLTNCIFDGNISPSNGGAISQSSGSASHDLTITNCVFNNNTATLGSGGAVSYSGQGTVTITNSTFTNNTAGSDGGALNLSGTIPGGFHNISKSTFSNNTANNATTPGAGGAIGGVQGQALTAQFNRFVGNLSPNLVIGASGKTIAIGGGTFTNIDVNSNWWGVNTGPAANEVLVPAPSLPPAVWLQLKTTASPSAIVTGQSTPLTSGFLSDSANNVIAVANLSALVGLPVTWSSIGGSVTSPQTTIQAAGTATATYNDTTGVAGSHSATAIVDSAPASGSTNTVALTVSKANTTPTITLDTPDPSNVGQAVTVNFTVTANSPGAGTPTGNVSISDGVDSATATVASGTVTITLNTAGNRTLTATYAGNANYNGGVSAGVAHVVTPLQSPQTITFTQPADSALSAGPVGLTATASSGLTVSFASTTPAVCTVSVASASLVSVGVCSISATQAGNASFAAATPVTKTFNVLKGAQTITFTQPADTALAAGPVSLTASASSGLAVSFASNSAAVCSVAGNSVTLVSVGLCSISALRRATPTSMRPPRSPGRSTSRRTRMSSPSRHLRTRR